METLRYISDWLVNFLCSSRFSQAGWISLVGKLEWRFFFHLGNATVSIPSQPEFGTVNDVVLENSISSQEKLSLKTQNDKCSWFLLFYSCFESLLNFSSRMFMQVLRQYLALALFLLWLSDLRSLISRFESPVSSWFYFRRLSSFLNTSPNCALHFSGVRELSRNKETLLTGIRKMDLRSHCLGFLVPLVMRWGFLY